MGRSLLSGIQLRRSTIPQNVNITKMHIKLIKQHLRKQWMRNLCSSNILIMLIIYLYPNNSLFALNQESCPIYNYLRAFCWNQIQMYTRCLTFCYNSLTLFFPQKKSRQNPAKKCLTQIPVSRLPVMIELFDPLF